MADSAGFLEAVRDWLNTRVGIGVATTYFPARPALEVTAVRGGEGYDRGGTEVGFWNVPAILIDYRDENGSQTHVVEDEDEITDLWRHLMAAWPT